MYEYLGNNFFELVPAYDNEVWAETKLAPEKRNGGKREARADITQRLLHLSNHRKTFKYLHFHNYGHFYRSTGRTLKYLQYSWAQSYKLNKICKKKTKMTHKDDNYSYKPLRNWCKRTSQPFYSNLYICLVLSNRCAAQTTVFEGLLKELVIKNEEKYIHLFFESKLQIMLITIVWTCCSLIFPHGLLDVTGTHV